MAKSSRFLPDRFDDVPEEQGYVGLRRLRREPTFWLIPAGIVVGLSIVLTGIGFFMVHLADTRLELSPEEIAITEPAPEEVVEEEPAPEPEPEPEVVEPITNPSEDEVDGLTITILNGTDTTGLAARAGNLLDREGWPEQTRTNSEESGVESSLVAYESDDDEALARGVAEILGITEIVQTDNYPGARITVLLGSDFTGN